MVPSCLSFFSNSSATSEMQHTLEHNGTDCWLQSKYCSMKLIGSDMPVKLRDGEQSSSYLISHLILALTRGLPDIRIEELLIWRHVLLSCTCHLLLLYVQGLCDGSAKRSGYQRLTSSLIPVYSNSCNCTWLRMRCVLTWGSTLKWSCLWRFVKEDLARISRLRMWVHWHFGESNNTPGTNLWSKSCSYSATESVLPQL